MTDYADTGNGGSGGGNAIPLSSATNEYDDYIPDEVKGFITCFHENILSGNINEIAALYDTSFPKLTEEYFRNSPWPEVELVAPLVNNDQFFLLLYRELYFRHIYACVPSGPTIHERLLSYDNYCDLFNFILTPESPISIELPNLWLWEIIDEFIYQFQSFQQYRSKLSNKNEEEMALLSSNPTSWSVLQVLNCLHSMVDKSNILVQLDAYAGGEDPDDIAGEFGRLSLYKMMGYFSLVALLRLHSLLGDYHQAVKALHNIDSSRNRALLNHVPPGCQITMAYYVGFAYVMMRRYSDAIRTFSDILQRIQRMQNLFQSKSYQHDQVKKQTERMFTLLSMCLVLHPQRRIDESILSSLTSDATISERMRKMSDGHIPDFETAFMSACPKFLYPSPPPQIDESAFENPDLYHQQHKDATRLQLRVFLDDVQQQMLIPTIRSYLKLYTSMPLEKLASYMSISVDKLESHLLSFKHKITAKVASAHASGVGKGGDGSVTDEDGSTVDVNASGLDGKIQSTSELEFYIDKNMIHIGDTKVDQRFGEFFIKQVHKLNDIHANVKSVRF